MANIINRLWTDLQRRRHVIAVKSVHEIQHEGVRLQVAKTNHGHLLLFPHAKKVSLGDVISMMNHENEKTVAFRVRSTTITEKKSRAMEWRGHLMKFDESAMGGQRGAFRVLGPFDIKSSQRKGSLTVMRRVRKLGTRGLPTPLEEALLLHKARNLGIKAELPIAVFLGRGKFPEMFFSTFIRGATAGVGNIKYGEPQPAVAFEDTISNAKASRGTFVDAEKNPRSPELVASAREIKSKIRKL